MTKDKIEALAADMAKGAKMSEEEGRKLAEQLHGESKKARKSLNSYIDGVVDAAVSRLPCQKRVKALEARLIVLEAAAGISPPPGDDAEDGTCCENEAADTKG